MAQLVEDCLTPLATGTKRDLALDALVSVEFAELQSAMEQSKQQKTREAPEAEPGDAEQERMYSEARQVVEGGGETDVEVGRRRRKEETEENGGGGKVGREE